ncbi:MAG: hypothetical protein ABSF69_29600 [Polyangiaceae bacterium]|jgi:hypothetical protein
MDAKTIDVSDVAELQERFRKALPRAETKVRYGKAIEMMASELYAMRSKGYGWSDIAEMLAEKGLHVTPSTLRNHLSHIKSEGAKAARGRRQRVEPARANVQGTVKATSNGTSAPTGRDAPIPSASASPSPRNALSTVSAIRAPTSSTP